MSINKRQKAQLLIDNNPLAVISLNKKHEAPHSSSVFVVRSDPFDLYFVTKSDTEKYRCLQTDNKISVTFSNFESQQTIQSTGEAEEITAEGGTMEELFKKLAHIKPKGDINWLPPIVKLNSGDYAIFQIKLDNLRYADFSKENLEETPEEAFSQIIGDSKN